MADQADAEIGVDLPRVRFAEHQHVGRIEGGEQSVKYRIPSRALSGRCRRRRLN